MKKIPNFFVVGAARSGTTSLYNYLIEHPEVYMSPIKEPNFFSTDINPDNFLGSFRKNRDFDYKKFIVGAMGKTIHQAWVRDKKSYFSLYKNVKDEKAVGEVSVSYLFSKNAAEEIHKFNPGAKIIIILRNPIKRAYSHYLMDKAVGVTDKNIIDLIPNLKYNVEDYGTRTLCLEFSLYFEQVKRYLDLFPKKNIKILFNEDLNKHPNKIMREVYKFLGVDTQFEPKTEIRHNPNYSPKSKIFDSIIKSLRLDILLGLILPESFKEKIRKMYFKPKTKDKLSKDEVKQLKKLYSADINALRKIIPVILPEDY